MMMGRDLLQDLRFGLRTLARQPGFALTAIVVLGLGIGASTTVLTLVNRIFFDAPPHVVQPDRLVRVWRSWAPGEGGGALQYPDYLYYRDKVSTLDGLAAWGGTRQASYTLDGTRSDQLSALFVSDNYFSVLGVAAARGRFFTPDENRAPGAVPVAVVSDGFWRRALAADPDVVGRTLSINDITFTVVGVAPPRFRGLTAFSGAPDVWIPIAMFGAVARTVDEAWWQRLPDARSNWLSVVGRLSPGETFEAADANLKALSDALTYDGRSENESVLVSRQALYSPSQAATLATLSGMLLAVVLIVLAIATANVAVLLLSRATTRAREMGIRTAVGAGRGRLFRQLLAEGLILGVAGGILGVALAYALSDAAASLLPYTFATHFAPDARVLAVALAVSVATAVLSGLAPALHAARTDVAASLEGTRTAGSRSRVRDVLAVAQMALSLVLVAGAVIFARSFWTARTQDLGFATENRLALQVNLRALDYTRDEGEAFIRQGLARLRALPGVVDVATTRMIPFRGDWSTNITPPPGALSNTEGGDLWIGMNAVSPHYFDVMGVRIVRGRPLGAEDGPGDPPALVINETLEHLLWPGRDGLGQVVKLGEDRQFTVVGIARNATYYELGEEPTTQAYGSVGQVYQPRVNFVLHTAGPPSQWVSPAEAALREMEPDLAFGWVDSMASVFEDVTAPYQVSAVLVGLFGTLALLLAAVGLYGVVSFLVAQRTREIGVRMALGADRRRVAGEVLRAALRLAGVGIVLGLGGALLLRGYTQSLLFGVRAQDPWALVAASAVLLGVAALAASGPAHRATRVDPMDAIRKE
jgi:predicted permease